MATSDQAVTEAPDTARAQEGAESSTSKAPAQQKRAPISTSRSELVTDQGRTSIADTVVAKIAGLACREISGVHEMGTGAARSFGAIRDRIPGTSDVSSMRGVNVEVGERQAAVDLDVVVEYGAAIVDVTDSVRRNVIGKVEAMTGLEVTEVNISVDDVFLGESEPPAEPRVQ